jgi:septal ring factor EnvC (AmiA/AmiB activator)
VLTVLLFLGVAAAAGATRRSLSLKERLDLELAALEKTRGMVEEKLGTREGDLRGRVRALYKLTRGGMAPLWVDERARAELVQRRAAARRLLLRDLEERRKLAEELHSVEGAQARLRAEAQLLAVANAPAPARRSLARPVPGRVVERFGPYRDRAARVRLVRRGVELRAHGGDVAVAPAPGRVLYAADLRALGTAVVIDHGAGLVSVVARLARAHVAPGTWVERGRPLGDPAGDLVYVELRRAGRPVDPEPFLARE